MKRFVEFLDQLTTPENSLLLEGIFTGYMACFESMNLPEFRIRAITEKEVDELIKKVPEFNDIPHARERLMTSSIVYSPNRPELPPAHARTIEEAKSIKKRLEFIASGVKFRGGTPVIPSPGQPSGVIGTGDNEESDLPPEIKSADNPQKKLSAVNFVSAWNRYYNNIKKISDYISEVNEKYPHLLELD